MKDSLIVENIFSLKYSSPKLSFPQKRLTRTDHYVFKLKLADSYKIFFSDILFSLYWQNYIVFDSQVAGGLSTGLSVRETVIKETNEEANLPKHIATQMKPAGCVRYLV